MNDQGRRPGADTDAVASPISATTVVHHMVDGEEHWTVLTGATVIAQCSSLEQAAELAGRMNESKRAGDQFMPSTPYTAPRQSLATAPKLARCQGLDIAPKPHVAGASGSDPHGAVSPSQEQSIT